MANRKAGSTGEGNTGDTKGPAKGKQSGGAAAGADQGTPAARKGAAGAGGSAARTRAAGAAAEGASPRKGASKSAAKGPAKGASKSAAKSPTKSAAKKTARGGGKADLRGDLRQFVRENPDGWGHQQWEGLLGQLGQRGHDTSNPEQIGMQLERERLASRLEGVEGVSAQRARSIAERFGTLYSLRNADVDEIASSSKISRDLAERIKSHLA